MFTIKIENNTFSEVRISVLNVARHSIKQNNLNNVFNLQPLFFNLFP